MESIHALHQGQAFIKHSLGPYDSTQMQTSHFGKAPAYC